MNPTSKEVVMSGGAGGTGESEESKQKDGAFGKALALQAWSPKFNIQKPCLKKDSAPGGRARSLQLAGQPAYAYLSSSRPVRLLS